MLRATIVRCVARRTRSDLAPTPVAQGQEIGKDEHEHHGAGDEQHTHGYGWLTLPWPTFTWDFGGMVSHLRRRRGRSAGRFLTLGRLRLRGILGRNVEECVDRHRILLALAEDVVDGAENARLLRAGDALAARS